MNREDAVKVVVALGLAAFMMSFLFATMVDRDSWFDESFTIATIHAMQEGKVDFTQWDVHPPGYYEMAYYWNELNPGIAEHMWLRYLSAICVGIFITFCGLLLLRVVGQWEALATTVLMTVNTTVLWYGQEARMYAPVLAFVAVAMFLMMREAQEGRQRFGDPTVWFLLFILPFIHYLAAVAVCFIVFVMFVFERWYQRRWWRVVIAAFYGCLGTLAAGLKYALPQHLRVSNLWFPSPTGYSAISGMFYALHIVADRFTAAKSTFVLFAFLFLLIVVIFEAMKKDVEFLITVSSVSGLFQLRSIDGVEEHIFLNLALGTLVFSIVGVIFGVYTGIYHHRFYLSVTWLFACAFYIILMKRWRWIVGVFFVLSIIFIGVLVQDELQNDREIQTMAGFIPCGKEVVVVHETPFTYFPFETYGRERCGQMQWHDILITELNVTEGHSYGLDAVNESDIIRLPGERFTLKQYYFVDGGMNYTSGEGCQIYQGMKGELKEIGVSCVK